MQEQPTRRDGRLRRYAGRLIDRLMGEPPAAVDARRPATRRGALRTVLLGQAAGFAVSPLIRLYAAPLLLAGTVLLTVAWLHGPQAWREAAQLRGYTARIDGTIAESWVALDFDPDDLGDSLYWPRVAHVQPCMVVNAVGDWGPPVQRAFCGDVFAFAEDGFALHDTLTDHVPFAWRRDAHGIGVPELRISDRARHWLATKPADPSGLPSLDAPSSAFAALRMRVDRSLLDRAIEGWLRPSPTIRLALDPAHPDDVLPAAYVEGGSRANPVLAVMAALFGLWTWWRGIALLTAGLPPAPRRFAAITPLFLLPWWAGHVPDMVARISPGLAPIAAELLEDFTRGVSLRVSAPSRARLADGTRVEFSLEQGDYAATLGAAMPSPPPRVPADADAALQAIADGVAVRVRASDAVARANLFGRLRGAALAGRHAVGVAFLPAARAALLDADADPATAAAAHDFLVAWLIQSPPKPRRDEAGATARRHLYQTLYDVGDADIAGAARKAAGAR